MPVPVPVPDSATGAGWFGPSPTPQPPGVDLDQGCMRQRLRLRSRVWSELPPIEHHPVEVDGDAVGDHHLDAARDPQAVTSTPFVDPALA